MYACFGPNVATSIIASVATISYGAPFIFLGYGKSIREASVLARYSISVYRYNHVDDDLNQGKEAVAARNSA